MRDIARIGRVECDCLARGGGRRRCIGYLARAGTRGEFLQSARVGCGSVDGERPAGATIAP